MQWKLKHSQNVYICMGHVSSLISNGSPDGHRSTPILQCWRPWQLRPYGVTLINKLAHKRRHNDVCSCHATQCTRSYKRLSCFTVRAYFVGILPASLPSFSSSSSFFPFRWSLLSWLRLTNCGVGGSERLCSLVGFCWKLQYAQTLQQTWRGPAFGLTHRYGGRQANVPKVVPGEMQHAWKRGRQHSDTLTNTHFQ